MFTFSRTIYITEKDNVFVNVERYEPYLLKSSRSVSEALRVFDENRNKANIIVDSRLTEIVIYLILKFGREVVIYDVNVNRFCTVFSWSRSLLLLNINLFNEEYLKKILFMYLLIVYYFREAWNGNKANEVIQQNNSKLFRISYIVEYLNIATGSSTFNTTLYNSIDSILSFRNLNGIVPVNKLQFKTVDIQTVLKQILITRNEIDFDMMIRINPKQSPK